MSLRPEARQMRNTGPRKRKALAQVRKWNWRQVRSIEMSAYGFQRKVGTTGRRERFYGVAQVSKPAVSPISKSAARAMSRGPRVWKPAIRQTGKSALQRSTPGAAPAPIFRTGAKAGCDGIVPEVT